MADEHDDSVYGEAPPDTSAEIPDSESGEAPRSPWRRRLLWAAAAVAAFLVLVVVPSYLATRPSFFARYPSLEEKYGPWSTSTHVGGGCETCHVEPGVLAQTAYRARMAGEFYLSFLARSREPDLFETPTNAACQKCHDDLRAVSPKGDLQIPHRAHVNILKMDCVECHNFLVHEKSPEGKHTPPMAGCLKCHDGEAAKDTCTACHTEKAAPESHRAADWDVVHAKRADDPECQKCHEWTERWCADCHARRPRSHGKDWRAVHGDRIAERRNCEACHEAEFCVRCHGEFPKDNLDPDLTIVQ